MEVTRVLCRTGVGASDSVWGLDRLFFEMPGMHTCMWSWSETLVLNRGRPGRMQFVSRQGFGY